MIGRITILWGLCAAVTSGFAVPMQTVIENWDGYALGYDDAAYNETWPGIPGASRYEVVAEPQGSATVWSPPNGLKIGKQRLYGITRDLMPEITGAAPDGTMVLGTDDAVLRVRFFVDFNSQNKQEEDIFVELSLGDVHVDVTSDTPRDLVAFGMTYGWFGSNPSPRIFNGSEWIAAPDVVTGKRSNHFTLEITSDSLTLIGGQNASGSYTIPRFYGGGFNRISIRTISQDDQTHMLDNLLVEGGDVIGGGTPAPSIASVEPGEGPTSGGTAVTVTGGDFLEGASVLFGGEAASDVVVVSVSEIACVTPAHDPGSVPVEVINPGGLSGVLQDAFRYMPAFRRGDANADGALNIADAVYILQNLFASGPKIGCPDAADSNDDEAVNIADAIYTLQNLFAQGPAIPEPHPGCGIDATPNPTPGGPELPPCTYCAALCAEPPDPGSCP